MRLTIVSVLMIETGDRNFPMFDIWQKGQKSISCIIFNFYAVLTQFLFYFSLKGCCWANPAKSNVLRNWIHTNWERTHLPFLNQFNPYFTEHWVKEERECSLGESWRLKSSFEVFSKLFPVVFKMTRNLAWIYDLKVPSAGLTFLIHLTVWVVSKKHCGEVDSILKKSKYRSDIIVIWNIRMT